MDKKKIAGEKATEYVKDGMILGLGTGSTAYHMVNKIGEMVKAGMDLKGVPTSKATEEQAKALGIPLLSINEVDHIDIDIDGVDEIDPAFNATKGGGGALFREKVVADLADMVIWICDDSKLVDSLGAFPLPIEILQYGYTQTIKKMAAYGWNPVLRERDGKVFVTDNGNYIVDLHLEKPVDIQDVKQKLSTIVGVLETGQFLNFCKYLIVGSDDGVQVIENTKSIKD